MKDERPLSFESDYNTGAHPKILEALAKTNLLTLPGYGSDEITEGAKAKIRKAVGHEDAEIAFLAGGTQSNAIVIASMLQDFEGAVAADTGHINSHEAGAVENGGRKVLTVPHHDGKIDPDELLAFVKGFYADDNREHMVYPGLVYISHPTEYGTLYTKKELLAIRKICDDFGMRLYLDGARLAFGLASPGSDVSLSDLADLCDAFLLGGTKCGLLLGEAIVFKKEAFPKHFVNFIKRRGALLAKGRVLGVQFSALFEDGLYFEIGRHAIACAEKMTAIFVKKGYRFALKTDTNQQFILLSEAEVKKLDGKLRYSFFDRTRDGDVVARFATGWSTTEEDLARLEEVL